MKHQLFTPCSILRSGQRISGMSIDCGKCPEVLKVPMNSAAFGGGDDSGVVARQAQRKFETAGWFIGGTKGQHRCPRCRGAEKAIKASAPTPTRPHPTQEQPNMTSAPDPKPMGREDRRLIFEKLNEVYGDEKTGYTGSWTDKLVAEDMGVPRAWVTTVRDEMFGPVASNGEIDAVLAQAKAVLGEIVVHLAKVAALTTRADELNRRVAAVEKTVRP